MVDRCEPATIALRQVGVTAPHTLPVPELLRSFTADPEHGLRSEQIVRLRERYGLNELAETPPTPPWRRLLSHFNELVIWILIAAAVIAGAMGEWIDAGAILTIVLLNGTLGFLQEERAGRALAALRRLSAPLAKVVRDGVLQPVPARDLVPGDLIELEAGDHVPADVRLVKTISFRTQEAALTGESVPVDKDARAVLPLAAPLAHRQNMAYMGTVAVTGKASAIVVGTGMDTELGRIAGMLQRPEQQATPLQRRLTELGRVLLVVCLAVVGIIFVLQLLRGGGLLEVLLLSVSLAVAAVPEGLPAVVTITLALGLQRMVKRNALIRKLPSVETLGSVTVICSDKTGTLTRNEMTVQEIVAGGVSYQVTGVGYVPRGQFFKNQSVVHPSSRDNVHPRTTAPLGNLVDPSEETDLIQALTIAARCNNARLAVSEGAAETWQVLGDPTEGALLVCALKAGVAATNHRPHVLLEIPFDSERKAMSVVVQEQDGRVVMYTKGAPEVILTKCIAERRSSQPEPLVENRRREILQVSAGMAARALRVLALAYRDVPDGQEVPNQEADLVFAGLVGMIDPPREEVKEAVKRCREAGIRPVMITGDHPGTALAIAHELGIATDSDRAITGRELDAMPDDELKSNVEQISVYARVAADHKLRVVRAWKSRGQVVAMTGDGVNDAPAVQAADIGIAMGVTGTDVTKEASAMVLMDDNFASIVNAVEEGRGIFDNIQKFLHFLLASNASEVLFMFFAALVGWPIPLLAIQILWINLMTDSLPALALGVEPPERDIMCRKPRPPHEPVITLRRGMVMLAHAILIAAVTALGFAFVYQGNETSLDRARTVAFCVVAYAQLFYSFSCRSQRYTMPQLGAFSNPHLIGAIAIACLLQFSVVTLPFARLFFESAQPSASEWALILGLALVPATAIEVIKIINRRTIQKPVPETER